MNEINSIASIGGQIPFQLLQAQRLTSNGPQPTEIKKIEKLAQDFEGVLLNKMMDEMQKTIPDSGMFSSAATRQVKGMFWMFLSQSLAEKGGIGLSKQLTRDFIKMANLSQPAPEPKTEHLK